VQRNSEELQDAGSDKNPVRADQPVPRELVRQHLDRILASELFNRSERLSRFLKFSVEEALSAKTGRVKEQMVGIEVFDRGPRFDARIDPIVRVEARRLRARLKKWYDTEGRDASIIIDLPTGTYSAVFSQRDVSKIAGAMRLGEKTIAVLPFTNLNSDPEFDYFSDGLTEELIHALTRLKDLRVVAWPTASRLKGQQDIAFVREQLQVANVLRGSVRRAGNRLRMTAQLVDTADGRYLWSEAWDRAPVDLLSIEQEIAQAIVDKLRVSLGDQKLERHSSHVVDTESHNLYLKGRFHWNKRTREGLRLALTYFERAAARTPTWDLAWAGLADVHVIAAYDEAPAEALLAARKAAKKALALNPGQAEAITALAFVQAAYDWDWQEVGELYREAIALNPGYATAHHWYGVDYLALLGRLKEAAVEVDIAVTLDPLSSITLTSRALVSMLAGRHEEAHRQYEELLQHDPSFFKAWSALGRLSTQMGDYRQAVQMLEKARSIAGDVPNILGALGQTFALAGQPERALELLTVLENISKTEQVASAPIALIHLGLGDRDCAVQRLEHAAEAHELSVMGLKVHPAWDPLRSEPRFQAILRRIRLAD
jgi:TolB-like protein/tetratricopeptide (TPR) repeat protein